MKNLVYFIRNEDGLIKIGRSCDVHRRFQTLQVSTHKELQLLGAIGEDIASEQEIHVLFADSRVRGEWFKENSELLAWIQEHASPLVIFNQRRLSRVSDASLALANSMVRRLSEPALGDDTKRARVVRAQSRLPNRWTYNRVRSIWVCDHRVRLTKQDMDELEAAVYQHEGQASVGTEDCLTKALERIAKLELLVLDLQAAVFGRKRAA